MKKYFVIATKWSEKDQKQVEFIAGEFYDYMNAEMFKKLYCETYKTYAEIKEFKA